MIVNDATRNIVVPGLPQKPAQQEGGGRTEGSGNSSSPEPAVVLKLQGGPETKPVKKTEQAGAQNLEYLSRGIRLSVDSDLNIVIAKIVDKDGTVVRQIPPEEFVKLAKDIQEELVSMLKRQNVHLISKEV